MATHLVVVRVLVGATSLKKTKAPLFQIMSGWDLAGMFSKKLRLDCWSQLIDVTS